MVTADTVSYSTSYPHDASMWYAVCLFLATRRSTFDPKVYCQVLSWALLLAVHHVVSILECGQIYRQLEPSQSNATTEQLTFTVITLYIGEESRGFLVSVLLSSSTTVIFHYLHLSLIWPVVFSAVRMYIKREQISFHWVFVRNSEPFILMFFFFKIAQVTCKTNLY